MSLELKIHGDAAGIRRVAEWLDPSLSQAAINADLELAYLIGDLVYMWTGESGFAFNAAANEARRTTMAVPTLAQDLAEVMRAYAGRMERGKDKFDSIAKKAREAGLTVEGRYIGYPTSWLKCCPGPDSPQEEKDEYEAYCKRIDKYNQFSEEVGTWEGELEVWIWEHFGARLGQVVEVAEAARVLEALVQYNSLVVAAAIEAADYRNAALPGSRWPPSRCTWRCDTACADVGCGSRRTASTAIAAARVSASPGTSSWMPFRATLMA